MWDFLHETEDGYSVGKTWGALKYCWKQYRMLKAQDVDPEVLEIIVIRIRRLAWLLHLKPPKFEEYEDLPHPSEPCE